MVEQRTKMMLQRPYRTILWTALLLTCSTEASRRRRAIRHEPNKNGNHGNGDAHGDLNRDVHVELVDYTLENNENIKLGSLRTRRTRRFDGVHSGRYSSRTLADGSVSILRSLFVFVDDRHAHRSLKPVVLVKPL